MAAETPKGIVFPTGPDLYGSGAEPGWWQNLAVSADQAVQGLEDSFNDRPTFSEVQDKTGIIDYERVPLAGEASVQFDRPSGARIGEFGWTGRSDQGSGSLTPVHMRIDSDDEVGNYERGLAFFADDQIDPSLSVFSTGSVIRIGSMGGSGSPRESGFTGTIKYGQRVQVDGVGFAYDGDQYAIHGGGLYTSNLPPFNHFTIFANSPAEFDNGFAWVRWSA